VLTLHLIDNLSLNCCYRCQGGEYSSIVDCFHKTAAGWRLAFCYGFLSSTLGWGPERDHVPHRAGCKKFRHNVDNCTHMTTDYRRAFCTQTDAKHRSAAEGDSMVVWAWRPERALGVPLGTLVVL
jgi:hypothetical protein